MHDYEQAFIKHFTEISEKVHECAVNKGFWTEGRQRNNGEMIALMHSELSEALEALRKGNPPDNKLPEFDEYTVELADCIIRIMDTAVAQKLPLAEAIIAKIRYNQGRAYKHGKVF